MFSPTLSKKKIDANRLNALKSTGPKTPDGKAKSAQNARRHNIFCKDLLVPGDDPQDLELFKKDILSSLNPRNVMELQLVEQIIADEWRIKRVRAAERGAYERLHRQDCQQAIEQAKRQRQEWAVELEDFEPTWRIEIRENRLPAQAAERRAWLTQTISKPSGPPPLPEPNPGASMLRLFADSPELDRLNKYEQRLRSSIHRCLKELRQLRDENPSDLSELTAGLLNEPDQNQAPVKNEPTETTSDGVAGTSDTLNESPPVSNPPIDPALTAHGRDIPPRGGDRLSNDPPKKGS